MGRYFPGLAQPLAGALRRGSDTSPEIDFFFFLNEVESLRQAHREFSLPNVSLVQMRTRRGLFRLGLQLPLLQWRYRIGLMHLQYRLPPLAFGPCACTIHDILFETHPQYFTPGFVWQSRLSSRAAVRSAAVLLSVSQFSRGEIARIYGIDPARVAVTYNAVDVRRFHPGQDGADAVVAQGLQPGNYLLTVGRLEPRKNHVTLLEAYAKLGPSAPPLVIIGQRDYGYLPLFDCMTRLGLQGRVRLLERVSDADLPALMRHASLFAYPAFAEGFGMPVLEALASGVPVVTSDTTSLPEVAGTAALLVPPDSVLALTQAMRSILDDPTLRDRMIRAGIVQAQRFNWEDSARVLTDSLKAFFQSKISAA